jgi:outer membrane biosynthesis protein TonB
LVFCNAFGMLLVVVVNKLLRCGLSQRSVERRHWVESSFLKPVAAPSRAARLPRSVSSQRRIKLFGRSDANAEPVNYAEAWARKIQMNTPADTVRELARQPHTNPVVAVAIRSDGSVESVKLELPSGQPAIDAAIERIVRGQASYPAFSPLLASQYDVVEIRCTWQFDTAVRLY